MKKWYSIIISLGVCILSVACSSSNDEKEKDELVLKADKEVLLADGKDLLFPCFIMARMSRHPALSP